MKRKLAVLVLLLALLAPLSGCKTLARAEGDSDGLHSWGVGVRF
jgi:hypothetical protein